MPNISPKAWIADACQCIPRLGPFDWWERPMLQNTGQPLLDVLDLRAIAFRDSRLEASALAQDLRRKQCSSVTNFVRPPLVGRGLGAQDIREQPGI